MFVVTSHSQTNNPGYSFDKAPETLLISLVSIPYYISCVETTLDVYINYTYHKLGMFNKLDFGPSGVRALPLAAGINKGGHYWSERSACAALGCWHKRRWPLF